MFVTVLCLGGLLLNAAEGLNDETLLLEIRGHDLVAIEVRYHQSCYKDYTNRFLNKHRKSRIQKGNEACCDDAFKKFCVSG